MRSKLAVVVLLLVPLAAAAQTRAERARAEQHFLAGEDHFRERRFDEAIAEYEKAYALVPLPVILYDIAQAYRLKGERELALRYYVRYIDTGDEGPAKPHAKGYVEALERELEAGRPVAEKAPPPAPRPAPPPRATERPRGRALRIAGLATAGGGVAAGVAALVFRARASDIAGEVAVEYSPSREADGRAAHRTFVILSAAGGAAIATGAVLYYLGWRARVAPAVTRESVGLRLEVPLP